MLLLKYKLWVRILGSGLYGKKKHWHLLYRYFSHFDWI